MTAPAARPTGHTGRSHAELLDEMAAAARAYTLVPHWDPTRTTGTPDHGRGLLDTTALALHVLWTYQGAWADEAALANARLPESVWRMLALVGYHPNPGTAAQGLVHLRTKDGMSATLPPGFRVTAPAAGELPAATYETSRAITVHAELNELRPFLPLLATPPPTTGAISTAVAQLQATPEVSVPGLLPFADALAGRFAAGRLASLAARNAARARQKAQQVADVLAQLRDAGAPEICGDSYQALCAQLCQTAEQGLAVPDDLGPLSESQELLAAQVRGMALRAPKALAGLEDALARCDGEDDKDYSARLDRLTEFLDALVAGILQEARDQVVRLHGSRALTVLDEQLGPAISARGVALPGSDALYLMPAPAAPGSRPTTQTALLAPGDWLVLAEDPGPGAPAGTPRRYHEAVQVLRVRDEVPPGLREQVTKVTLTPPLRRRHSLDRTVVLGNVAAVSHGVTTVDTADWRRDDGPVLPLASGPLTWLQRVDPEKGDGREPQVEVSLAGRSWARVADLRQADVADAAFAVEVDAAGRSRVRVGPGAPERAVVEVRYRTGLGAAGNRPALAVTTIAAAHPALLSTLNPLPMTGGADAEPVDISRARATGGIHALDRAVSLADVASLAQVVPGVRRACAFRDAVRRRDHVTVVAAGTDGRILAQDELDHVRAFLVARMPPGSTVRVVAHRQVPVRARIQLRILPGADPLAAIATARRSLGAAAPMAGEEPGLLAPQRVELGADLHASAIYGALAGVPAVASAHVAALCRASEPLGGRVLDATADRALPPRALPVRGALLVPAGPVAPGSVVTITTLPAGRRPRRGGPAASYQDRIEVPRDAVATWAPPDGTGDDGLVLTWEEAGES